MGRPVSFLVRVDRGAASPDRGDAALLRFRRGEVERLLEERTAEGAVVEDLPPAAGRLFLDIGEFRDVLGTEGVDGSARAALRELFAPGYWADSCSVSVKVAERFEGLEELHAPTQDQPPARLTTRAVQLIVDGRGEEARALTSPLHTAELVVGLLRATENVGEQRKLASRLVECDPNDVLGALEGRFAPDIGGSGGADVHEEALEIVLDELKKGREERSPASEARLTLLRADFGRASGEELRCALDTLREHDPDRVLRALRTGRLGPEEFGDSSVLERRLWGQVLDRHSGGDLPDVLLAELHDDGDVSPALRAAVERDPKRLRRLLASWSHPGGIAVFEAFPKASRSEEALNAILRHCRLPGFARSPLDALLWAQPSSKERREALMDVAEVAPEYVAQLLEGTADRPEEYASMAASLREELSPREWSRLASSGHSALREAVLRSLGDPRGRSGREGGPDEP